MTWVEGPMLGFDLETTGIDIYTALPVQFALVSSVGGKDFKARKGYINPGIPIPEETTKIHHITDKMVQERGGALEASVFGIVGSLWEAYTAGTPIVGMNLRYDLSIIDTLYRGYNKGVGLSEDGWDGRVIDVSVIDRHVDQYRKGGRKLADLCKTYWVGLPNAHDAAGDATASCLVAIALAKKYKEVGEADLDLLHTLQIGWRREWCKSFSEYQVSKGKAPLTEVDEDWPIARPKES